MWPNQQKTADFVILTKEILNGKLHFWLFDLFFCKFYLCDIEGSKGTSRNIKSKVIPRNFHMLWDSNMFLSDLARTLRFRDMKVIFISLINFKLHINRSAHSDWRFSFVLSRFFRLKLTNTCRNFTYLTHELSSLESFLYIWNFFVYISLYSDFPKHPQSYIWDTWNERHEEKKQFHLKSTFCNCLVPMLRAGALEK